MNDPFVIRYITFEKTKLVDQNNKFYNEIMVSEAQKMANNSGLDLVCFNRPEGSTPAFCKIISFNKWKYANEKKKQKEKQHKKHNKEVRFSPNIAENDIFHKTRQIHEFLEEGDDVTLTMKLRGREKLHFKEADEKMNQIVKMCEEHGKEIGRKKLPDLIIVHLVKK